MVMSLVYDRGTILASKRTTYEDLESVSFDEKQVGERVSRQHKLMCAAVMAGRISELVDMTRKSSAYASKGPAAIAHEEAPAIPVQAGMPVPPTVLRPISAVADSISAPP